MSDAEAVDARAVRITFADGKTRSFAFEPKLVDPTVLASAFQNFIDQGYINLEMDDRLVIIPLTSVQSVEIAPKPEGNLPNAVKILHEFD